GRPDLAATHDVAVIGASREGFDARGIETGIGLGNTEAGFLLALDQWRQHALLLLRAAMHDDGMRSEDVEMDRGRGGITATAARHRLHHDRSFGDAQARTA